MERAVDPEHPARRGSSASIRSSGSRWWSRWRTASASAWTRVTRRPSRRQATCSTPSGGSVERPAPTLVDCLLRAADAAGEGLRFLDRRGAETWLPWSDVLARALGVAGGLRALGVGPGERVALVFPTSAEFFDAFFGVCSPARSRFPSIRRCASVGWTSTTPGPRACSSSPGRGSCSPTGASRCSRRRRRAARPALGCRRLADLERMDVDPCAVDRNDLALVQFSSGTTRRAEARRAHSPGTRRAERGHHLVPPTARRHPAVRRHLAAALPRHGSDRMRLTALAPAGTLS